MSDTAAVLTFASLLAMVTLAPQYNTWRMVQEYTQKYYLTVKAGK